MRNTHYNMLIKVVDGYLIDINTYFLMYNTKFEKITKEMKSQSYGGYRIKHMEKEFEQEINYKCTELLEKIETLFTNSGRKLSTQQYDDLINRCTNKFNVVIDNYHNVFQKEFEFIESSDNSFRTLKKNIASKINCNIQALKLISNIKINKDLYWTAWGVIISSILAIIAIIVSLFSK